MKIETLAVFSFITFGTALNLYLAFEYRGAVFGFIMVGIIAAIILSIKLVHYKAG